MVSMSHVQLPSSMSGVLILRVLLLGFMVFITPVAKCDRVGWWLWLRGLILGFGLFDYVVFYLDADGFI
ncbi:hypothetical protein EUGRSUZ_L03614 [Eucalyptus grandis]|uniref:Transmembrane protein n=1 Tax=Eucalyptus grandis TaxID=71139 RepID=A0AAD9WHM6_EUCGR|nr:hypothetical protein EUGRSUZ_L03614 [Eucalyptus grandis]